MNLETTGDENLRSHKLVSLEDELSCSVCGVTGGQLLREPCGDADLELVESLPRYAVKSKPTLSAPIAEEPMACVTTHKRSPREDAAKHRLVKTKEAFQSAQSNFYWGLGLAAFFLWGMVRPGGNLNALGYLVSTGFLVNGVLVRPILLAKAWIELQSLQTQYDFLEDE